MPETVSSADVQQAVLTLLCHASVVYQTVPEYAGRNGVGGLFSQKNHLAQHVLQRLYLGHRPSSSWHSQTTLKGYGNAPLADHFFPIPCHGARSTSGGVSRVDGSGGGSGGSGGRIDEATAGGDAIDREAALATVRAAPRHLVVSHLLHALYRPRAMRAKDMLQHYSAPPEHPELAVRPPASIDLAIHVRRGDRLTVDRASEKIRAWDEAAVVEEVRRLLPANGTVLIASDDDAFSSAVTRRLGPLGYTVLRHRNDHEHLDAQNRSAEAALACDASCVPPLLSLVQLVARARRVVMSSKSNLGSFLLSWWFAANEGAAPTAIFDLDGVVSEAAIFRQHRYFCELPWGSRRGMCKGNQTACELPAFRERNFCVAKHPSASPSGPRRPPGAS